MLIFGGTSDTDKDCPEQCSDPLAIINLDLHEWMSVGEMSGPVPTNMIFHNTFLIDDESKSRLASCRGPSAGVMAAAVQQDREAVSVQHQEQVTGLQ